MPQSRKGATKEFKRVSKRGYTPKKIPKRIEEEPEPRRVPSGKGSRDEQSPATGPRSTEEPEPEREPVTFTSYTPLDTSKLTNVKVPVDPSGAASESGVIVMTGNVYLAVSKNDGGSFSYFDPTTMFPKFAGGIVGDQQIIHVPAIDRFVWIMLHNPVPASSDGAFRLAMASSADVAAKPKSAWSYVDFIASDFGLAGVFLDQPHLAYSNRHLIIAVDAKDKGRIVVRIRLDDLVQGQIGWEWIGPLTVGDSDYQFSAPASGGPPPGVFMAGHIDTGNLRVVEWLDGSTGYAEHDVVVAKWSDSDDYSCTSPSGVDWSSRCQSRISGATWRDQELWISWMSPRSKPGDAPNYPQPYTRVVTIDQSTFKVKAGGEMQVWNPDYVFAYSTLAVNSNGEVAIAVAWGGRNDEVDTAFGILGDFVVWYQDGSTASNKRWGDFLRTHRSLRTSTHFDGFGYFTNKSGSKIVQKPFHVRYGR